MQSEEVWNSQISALRAPVDQRKSGPSIFYTHRMGAFDVNGLACIIGSRSRTAAIKVISQNTVMDAPIIENIVVSKGVALMWLVVPRATCMMIATISTRNVNVTTIETMLTKRRWPLTRLSIHRKA